MLDLTPFPPPSYPLSLPLFLQSVGAAYTHSLGSALKEEAKLRINFLQISLAFFRQK